MPPREPADGACNAKDGGKHPARSESLWEIVDPRIAIAITTTSFAFLLVQVDIEYVRDPLVKDHWEQLHYCFSTYALSWHGNLERNGAP
jgi:hypothetical protein